MKTFIMMKINRFKKKKVSTLVLIIYVSTFFTIQTYNLIAIPLYFSDLHEIKMAIGTNIAHNTILN